MKRIVTLLLVLLFACGCSTMAVEGPPGQDGAPGAAGKPGAPGPMGPPGQPYMSGARLTPLVWKGNDGSMAVMPGFDDAERGEDCYPQLVAGAPVAPTPWRCVPPITYGEFLGWDGPGCDGARAGGANSFGRLYHMTPENELLHVDVEIPEMYWRDVDGVCKPLDSSGAVYRWLPVSLSVFVQGVVEPAEGLGNE